MQPDVGRKLLYMSEVYQGLYYFRHFEKDDWKLKVNPLYLQPSFALTQFLFFTDIGHRRLAC
jgi:hypothetical protein